MRELIAYFIIFIYGIEKGLLVCYLSIRVRDDFERQYEKLDIYYSRTDDSLKNLWK